MFLLETSQMCKAVPLLIFLEFYLGKLESYFKRCRRCQFCVIRAVPKLVRWSRVSVAVPSRALCSSDNLVFFLS